MPKWGGYVDAPASQTQVEHLTNATCTSKHNVMYRRTMFRYQLKVIDFDNL